MEVFLVPVGPDRYELYCEVPDEPNETHDAHEPHDLPTGRFRRLLHRLADRFPRKPWMITMQSWQLALTLVIAALVAGGQVEIVGGGEVRARWPTRAVSRGSVSRRRPSSSIRTVA